ncbi:MAG: hypothetical protein OEW12_04330 [Deltaproteobacteria bacterium]|nr:hypothetical protein [Deltaproteobacteria bacterium]
MKTRTPISLFPFLSVLLSTMGILSFLAITFMLIARQNQGQAATQTVREIKWVGAPEYVRPVLVECRSDGVRYHPPKGRPVVIPYTSLLGEMERLKQLDQSIRRQLGPGAESFQVWLMMKTVIQNDPVLAGGFIRRMHDLEMENLRWRRSQGQESYPIMLIYPDGVKTFDLASLLLETATRLKVGLEPMLEGWRLPFGNMAGQGGPPAS